MIGEGFREWLKPLLKDKKGLGLLVKKGIRGYPLNTKKGPAIPRKPLRRGQ